MLDKAFELRNFTHWIIFLVELIKPIFILFFSDIKLNTIVTRCNSLDIKINKLIVLNAFYVIEKHDCV